MLGGFLIRYPLDSGLAMISSLSHRERVLLALNHQTTDRIPIAMVCSGINQPAASDYDQYLQNKRGITLDHYLNSFIDILSVEPFYIGPPLANGFDIWGVHRRPHSFGAGQYDEIDNYPLAGATIDDVISYNWPSTSWFNYNSLNESIARANANGEHCLMISNGNVFESAWYLRGFEQTFMDFILNPEIVYSIMERVTKFHIEHFSKILDVARGRIDLVFTADDIGGQDGLLTSIKTWETFIKPFHQQMNKAIHEYGVKVIYHTDGSIMKAVPGLIDMGIDVLQALQFSAKGMDPRALKENYGERLCFEGGVSVQTTLPFGTTDDVRSETEMLIQVLGKNGGYILGPSHAIQAGTPPENIDAMFETALRYPL
jgi:uroporphyrinogen decarboxylase